MAIIHRTRVIRPSTRKPSSKNYRVNVEKVLSKDKAIITIKHESEPLEYVFEIGGDKLNGKPNISFRPELVNNEWQIHWSGASPRRVK